ncbi:MAG: hypothetical protein WD673_14205, partial [Alphaproteobacteria bacterium]
SAPGARALVGATIAGVSGVGRALPGSLAGLARRIDRLLAETAPALVIATGLAPGEPVIRLERIGVNLADFDLPDNRDRRARDRPLVPGGPDALFATLPLRAIERRLLARGIPVRLSETAGLYLCNATLYGLLAALRGRRPSVPCGFIHLPCLPNQVADVLRRDDKRVPVASMDLAVMTETVEIAVATTARLSGGKRRPARRAPRSGTGRSA